MVVFGLVASLGTGFARAEPGPRSLKQVVYVALEGERLVRGGSDAHASSSPALLVPELAYPALDWEPLGGRARAQPELLVELARLFRPWQVELVTTRPAAGPYTMVVVGGRGEGVLGAAEGGIGASPLDCENTQPSDVSLVFADRVDSPARLALVIAHELGHTFGLEHVDDLQDIMYPTLSRTACCFGQAELKGTSSCGRTVQDARKILDQNLGLALSASDGTAESPAAGCAVVPVGRGAASCAALAFVALLALLRRRRRPIRF